MLPLHSSKIELSYRMGEHGPGEKKKKNPQGQHDDQRRRNPRAVPKTCFTEECLFAKILLFLSSQSAHQVARRMVRSLRPKLPRDREQLSHKLRAVVPSPRCHASRSWAPKSSWTVGQSASRWLTVSGAAPQKTQVTSPVHPLASMLVFVGILSFRATHVKILTLRGDLVPQRLS